MIIQQSKKYLKIFSFILLAIIAISFCATKVRAEIFNGTGGTYAGCIGKKCACNQGSSQLCLWDNKNHVLLKVSLYYFPNATGLSGGVELGSEFYVKGNWTNYKGYFSKPPHLLGSNFNANGSNDNISAAAKSYFFDTPYPHFYDLFQYITGIHVSSNAEIQNWMENYCKSHGYGQTIDVCHSGIPGQKGFRIVIQPILTGIYGSGNTIQVGTVKSIYGSFNIWNNDNIKRSLSAIMYLNQSDLGFSKQAAGGSTDRGLVASVTSGYGLNMFDWPIKIIKEKPPCNPDVSGISTCCTTHSIKLEIDANNHDVKKVTRPMTQDELDDAGCRPLPTCEYKLDKSIPSICTNNVSGLVADNATWRCVLTSTNSDKDTTVRNNYAFSSFSNRYCSVYCKENIDMSFPGVGSYTDAGTYFTITSIAGYQTIGPIIYKGTSTCRVTSQTSSEDGVIDVAQFVTEFKAADHAVLVAYDNWQYAELQNEVMNNATGLKAAYESAVNYRTSLLEELKKCNNFYRTYKEFKPNVTITYEDDLYKNTYTLKATGSATSSTEYFSAGNSKHLKNTSTLSYSNSVRSDASNEITTYNTDPTSVRGYSSLINYYNCGHSVTKVGCSAVSQYLYPTNVWYEQTTKRTYTYTLQDGLNNYVDKPSGFSSSKPTANYDYIPFSNLPIHYSTKPGNYNYYITTTTYGPNNKFNSYIIGTTNFNRVSYHADTKYACTYKVSPNITIICVPGTNDPACSVTDGTDLIYRPISLYYPFPGQNATTVNLRKAGKNWATASGTDAISKYIYNNRGVSYYELYKLQPMYEVTLTPALMRKIKQYNTTSNNTKEWYYKGTAKQVFATVGYSDFTLNCETKPDGSKSSQCTSSIIRSWGVKGCAISGSGYTKCGNTVAW